MLLRMLLLSFLRPILQSPSSKSGYSTVDELCNSDVGSTKFCPWGSSRTSAGSVRPGPDNGTHPSPTFETKVLGALGCVLFASSCAFVRCFYACLFTSTSGVSCWWDWDFPTIAFASWEFYCRGAKGCQRDYCS